MKYISVEDAGKKFNLSARSIRNYCAQGRIPGAVLSGKTWLIPEGAVKPERINSKNEEYDLEVIKNAEDLISFINESPVDFLAIENVKQMLIEHGYKEVKEQFYLNFENGEKAFIIRNDLTILAFNIGKNVSKENTSFNIIVSHADSPCFKLKPECNGRTDVYSKINVAPYGGMIAPSWMDRPLGIAGRIIIEDGDEVYTKLVNLSEFTVLIPNLCIHYNRQVNSGYEYNMAIDLQPFLSLDKDVDFVHSLSKRVGVDKEEIINFDLALYNKQSGVIWGERREFLSAPRLDDLECVYLSARAFVETENDNSINVLYIADNEEVGSLSRQGADSDFLSSNLKRVSTSLGVKYEVAIGNSFMVSADNAHAVHPNKPEVSGTNNKVYMNKGVVIKFNAYNSYATDGLSGSIFQKICKNASVPYQFFTNRSDIRGGSTLGKELLSQVSVMSVDIGFAQLAMHSSYETTGVQDVTYGLNVFKEFYKTHIHQNNGKYKVSK